MANKSQKNNIGKVVAVSAGVAALSAAAYLLLGPDGKKNRKNLRSWMVKMKAEVAEKLEDMKDVSAETYESIVDEVSKKYRSMKNIDQKDVQAEITDLKKHWKNMLKHAKGASKKIPSKKTAKKAIKKAVKKVSKKKSR